ncbi:MAG TPA: DUF3078 domain-containing protein [Flavobacteriaceae bacterium]|nr:DUF3078 domain-containing protein [Flavobacteriaceae bacterium]
MKSKFFYILFFALTINISAQETTKPQGWTSKGNFNLLFNQSAFSNWVAGGDNTIAGNVGLNYDLNYVKGNFSWNNKILASYGLTKSNNTNFEKKTDDRLEYNTLLGYKAEKNWYYSVLFNFKTQFTKGFKYFNNEEGVEKRTNYTAFFSPAYFKLGPGMLWKKGQQLKVNIAPATAKVIVVDKKFTEPNAKYFGVEEGENQRLELGFNASAYYKLAIMENVSVENIIALYANYLENPENVDLDYTLNLVLKVNKYLSTNLIFQTIYDDNAYQGFQVREVFGVGLNYIFKNKHFKSFAS